MITPRKLTALFLLLCSPAATPASGSSTDLGKLIAAQGNQALLEIREDLQRSVLQLRPQAVTGPVSDPAPIMLFFPARFCKLTDMAKFAAPEDARDTRRSG